MSNLSDVLRLLNPWWGGGTVDPALAKPYRRKFFEQIKAKMAYRQVVILTGLRRVGKTTLLYQTIQSLLPATDAKRIFYFNFDKETTGLIDLFEEYQTLTGVDYKAEKIFVFFDEITRLSDWARQLKLLYDAQPHIRFILSSSGSISLEEDAMKNLAGRYFLVNVTALRFAEFLELSEKHRLLHNPKLHEPDLRRESSTYLLRSFPETIFWTDELLVRDYLKTTIINRTLLYTLLELFYTGPGYFLDYDSLSRTLRISKQTLFRHMFYLDFCYLIRIVRNFRPSTLSASRKLQRVYPYWWSLAYGYGPNPDKMLETLVFSSLDGKYYWRELTKEIDMIHLEGKALVPIEIKNTDKVDDRDLRTLRAFGEKYRAHRARVIYTGREQEKKLGAITVRFVPVWKFLLEC